MLKSALANLPKNFPFFSESSLFSFGCVEYIKEECAPSRPALCSARFFRICNRTPKPKTENYDVFSRFVPIE